jgi:Flp pilus assembly protein TadG
LISIMKSRTVKDGQEGSASVRKRWKRASGQSLVEFAIVLIVLTTCIFGIFDFSRLFYAYHFVSFAARQGTRYAIVRGSSWTASCADTTTLDCRATASNVQSYVQSIVPPGITAASVTATTTWPGTTPSGAACTTTSGVNSPGCRVKVVVTYPFTFSLPFMPKSALSPLTSTSEVVISQ